VALDLFHFRDGARSPESHHRTVEFLQDREHLPQIPRGHDQIAPALERSSCGGAPLKGSRGFLEVFTQQNQIRA
jgi:hypothetical protein